MSNTKFNQNKQAVNTQVNAGSINIEKFEGNIVLNPNQLEGNDLKRIAEQIEAYKKSAKLKKGRKPKILVCGKTGVGKTTAINTLFGKEVGAVGHYTRGTSKSEIYEWESNSSYINVVDLPGLGDAPKNDRMFREIYRKHATKADGVIVIVNPPRPAEEGTLKTIRLLVACGIPSTRIVFGFNKLSYLQYKDEKNTLKNIEVDGLIGPTNKDFFSIIEEAKKAFYKDLTIYIPRKKFNENQIIEFDSLSGWNLHSLLLKVIEPLPLESLAAALRAHEQASKEAIEREREVLIKEINLIEEKKALLSQLKEKQPQVDNATEETQQNANNFFVTIENKIESGVSSGKSSSVQSQIKQTEKEISDLKSKVNERSKAVETFQQEEKSIVQKTWEKVVQTAKVVVEKVTEIKDNAVKWLVGLFS